MKQNIEVQAMCELTQQEIDGVAGGNTIMDAVDSALGTVKRLIDWINETM